MVAPYLKKNRDNNSMDNSVLKFTLCSVVEDDVQSRKCLEVE